MTHPEIPGTATVVPFPAGLPESDRKALAAIDRFIANPPDNSRKFWITPAMAIYLRERYNIDNRPEKPVHIGRYAADMAAGEWRLTGDTIKFSDRGLLRDGQNRLRAGEKSGAAFETHIVFGIADEWFTAMDRGKNRDGGDLLAIEGVSNPKIVAGAVRWAHLFDTDTVKTRTTPTAPEILRLYREQLSGVVDYVPFGRAAYSLHGWPPGFIAGTLYYLAQIDQAAAMEFGKAIANSNFSGKFIPLERMRAKLAVVAKASSGRVHETLRAALLIVAWNLYRDHRKGTQKDFEWDVKQSQFPVAK